MAKGSSTDMDFVAHRETYDAFVKLTTGAVIVSAISLFALLAMTVIGGVAFWVGAIGLIVGIVVVAVTLALRLAWTPSLLVLAAMVVLSILTL